MLGARARRVTCVSEDRPLLVPDARPSIVSAPLSTEAELIARLRTGDESACESLFLAHHEALWRFAYGYVRSTAIAEEIVQDVFLALWRDRADCEITASMRAWLYAAVRNHALNHLRHERVVARLADHGIAREQTEPAVAETTIVAEELDRAVIEALAALPERRRVAMTLRWKHDLTPAEIARVLGTTPEAVRVLLTRARHELSSLLERVRR
jgi:RNA polymerase sigma-70 factor (ECF subfamily)